MAPLKLSLFAALLLVISQPCFSDFAVPASQAQNTPTDQNANANAIALLQIEVNALKGQLRVMQTQQNNYQSTLSNIQTDVSSNNQRMLHFDNKLDIIEDELADTSLETRVGNVENGLNELRSGNTPIAFNAKLDSRSSKPALNQNLVFDSVTVNQGNGYDVETGVFTVPSDGSGLYYISFHLLVMHNKYAYFEVHHNGNAICASGGDGTSGGDTDALTAACSAIVSLSDGDTVNVQCMYGKCADAIYTYRAPPQPFYPEGFNGFRISA